MRLKLIAVAPLLLSTACAQAPAVDDSPASQAAPVEQHGPQEEPVVISDHHMCEHAVRLIVNPQVARPGATLRIFSDHPLGYAPPLDVPDELLTHWRASPQGVATFTTEGAVKVSENAAPGSDLTLTALYCGKEEVTKTVPIAGKDQPVIVGYWKQESMTCPADTPQHQPVRELVFEPGGGFSVTYMPFESYKDFWGTHRFDHRTGALDVTLTGGNRPPASPDLSGAARLETDKRLVLEDVFLGPTGHPGAGCRYVFVK